MAQLRAGCSRQGRGAPRVPARHGGREPAARSKPFPIQPPVLHTDSPGAPEFNYPFLLPHTAIRRPGDEDAEVRKLLRCVWGLCSAPSGAPPPSNTQTTQACEHRKDKSVQKPPLSPSIKVPYHHAQLCFCLSNSLLAVSGY